MWSLVKSGHVTWTELGTNMTMDDLLNLLKINVADHEFEERMRAKYENQ